MTAQASAEEITRSSKSNLALAFVALPKAKRRDITTFYAFCRVVDDIADAPDQAPGTKQVALDAWKGAIQSAFLGEPLLAAELRGVISKYGIRRELLLEIIAGVEMDLKGAAYQTFEDLRLYCYRVASAVGLVSIEIFGYSNPLCRQYAIDLGLALQMTNILRDVGQDFDNEGRVYLPLEDMARFGCTVADIENKRAGRPLLDLMQFEAARAHEFYRNAIAHLPPEDRKAMTAAEIMRKVYSRLLAKMQSDGFRVFDKRYSLSKVEKLCIVGAVLLASLGGGASKSVTGR